MWFWSYFYGQTIFFLCPAIRLHMYKIRTRTPKSSNKNAQSLYILEFQLHFNTMFFRISNTPNTPKFYNFKASVSKIEG